MNKVSKMIVVAAVLMGLWCGGAQACLPGMWLPGFASGKLESRASNWVLWDPDGAGPKKELLVFNTSDSGLMGWDGIRWLPISPGIHHIIKIVVYHGDIIGLGIFYDNMGPLAKWDVASQSWVDLLHLGVDGFYNLYDMVVYDDKIWILGTIIEGSEPDNSWCYFGTWDGVDYTPEIGVSDAEYLHELSVANGKLYALGSSNSLCEYNGLSWVEYPSIGAPQFNRDVFATEVTSFDGNLIVGGQTAGSTRWGGDPGDDYIYRWESNTWNNMGDTWRWKLEGIDPVMEPCVPCLGCYDFCEYNNKLYATYVYEYSSENRAASIVRWSGTAWESLLDSSVELGWTGNFEQYAWWGPEGLSVYNNQLVMRSVTGAVAGNIKYPGYAVLWDDQRFRLLAQGINYGQIEAMAVDATTNTLYAGGFMDDAGGVGIDHIGRWNGDYWEPVGKLNSTCSALILWDRDGSGPEAPSLVAGGSFTQADGVTVNNIARWNGTSWEAMGSGLSDKVMTLCVYNGQLYAGGSFHIASGSTTVNHIARWNGTSWSAVGNGFDSEVMTLSVYNSQLVAGGSFSYSGSTPVNRIARWNGTAWVAMGSGFNNNSSVKALCVYNSKLYAGGTFTTSGSTTVNRIARWSGSAWQPLMSGIPGTDSSVNALTVYDGELIVGGQFEGNVMGLSGSSFMVRNIARWTGGWWQGMGYGITGRSWDNTYQAAAANVYALTTYHDPKANRDELYIGGDFDMADNPDPNTSKPSLNIAHWIKRP